MSTLFAFGSKPALLVAASGVALAAAGVVAWRVAMNPPSFDLRPASPSTETAAPPVAPAPVPAPSASSARPAPPAPAPPSVAAVPAPSFDVVRVEPTGEAVIAGRAAPGARVRLVDQGQTIAEGTADAAGQFVMMPRLTAGPHELGIMAEGADKGSKQSVTVVVAADRAAPPLVALATPGEATRVLSGIETPKPGPTPQVFVKTVEATPEGRLMVSGTGSAGAGLRLYLDDAPLAQATADANGAWSVALDRPLTPQSYRVRADEIGHDGSVVARSEVTFDWAGAPIAAAGEPASIKTTTVKVARGDSLWRISRAMFGAGRLYTQIYEANSKQIRDRSRIYPGQVFVVPKT